MKNKKALIFVAVGIVTLAGLVLVIIKYLDRLTELFNDLKRSIYRFELKLSGHPATNPAHTADYIEFNEFDDNAIADDHDDNDDEAAIAFDETPETPTEV